MQQGHIRLKRSFKDWKYYSDPSTCRLFEHLLISANYFPQDYLGTTINKGQYLTTQQELVKETGLTRQQIRTSLHKLSVAHELITSSIKVQKKFGTSSTLITICNYDSYLDEQPSNNQATTKNQEEKEEKSPIPPKEDNKKKANTARITFSEENVPIKKSAAKKRRSSSVSLVTKCRQKFEEFFLHRYSEPYYWTGVDGKATKDLLNKLKFSRKSHTPAKPTDDDSMVEAFVRFIKLISNNWLFDNFDMKTINSQYNKIVASYNNPVKYNGDNYTSLKDPMAVEHSGDTSENYFKKKITKDPFRE